MAARGERSIKVNGREVHVLFTNRALANVERRLEKTISGLFENKDSLGITETAVLLHVGMEAARVDARSGGHPVSMNDVWNVLDEVGWTEVLPVVVLAVADVLTYSAADDEYSDSENGADPNA